MSNLHIYGTLTRATCTFVGPEHERHVHLWDLKILDKCTFMGPENWHEMLINFRVHNFFVCLSVGVSGENGWGVCCVCVGKTGGLGEWVGRVGVEGEGGGAFIQDICIRA